MSQKIILLTNDDGIDSYGLKFLQETVADLGETNVVAPLTDQSAASHSFTLRKPIKITRIKDNWFGVKGTPTDCVLISHHGIFKSERGYGGRKIDLLISGINDSPNLGEDVLYSGTVAAAIEGTILGIPSFALSVLSKDSFKFSQKIRDFIRFLAEDILRKGLPKKTLFNINIPDKEIRGIKITTLGKRIYKDIAIETRNARGERYYTIDGSMDYHPHRGSDFEAVYSGYISITPLHLDMTHYRELATYRKRFKGIKI